MICMYISYRLIYLATGAYTLVDRRQASVELRSWVQLNNEEILSALHPALRGRLPQLLDGAVELNAIPLLHQLASSSTVSVSRRKRQPQPVRFYYNFIKQLLIDNYSVMINQ